MHKWLIYNPLKGKHMLHVWMSDWGWWLAKMSSVQWLITIPIQVGQYVLQHFGSIQFHNAEHKEHTVHWMIAPETVEHCKMPSMICLVWQFNAKLTYKLQTHLLTYLSFAISEEAFWADHTPCAGHSRIRGYIFPIWRWWLARSTILKWDSKRNQ